MLQEIKQKLLVILSPYIKMTMTNTTIVLGLTVSGVPSCLFACINVVMFLRSGPSLETNSLKRFQ